MTKFIDFTLPKIILKDDFKGKYGNFNRANFNKEYNLTQETVFS